MSDFAKFLAKYAGEALSVASTLGTLLEGLALSPSQNAKVQATIDKLETAAANLANYKDTTPVKISKADIDKAVADYFASAAGKAAIVDATKPSA